MKRALISILFVLIGNFSHANPQSIITILGMPTTPVKGLVVIAPAKKYLMRERLFEELATSLTNAGFIAVRFNWGESTLLVPELELQRAANDISEVAKYFQQKFGISSGRTVIVSKSFSTKALTPSIPLASHHVLLTPNCSIEAPFLTTYQELLLRPDISLSIFISNEDPNCDVRQIYETLSVLPRGPTLFITHGDHNFVSLSTELAPRSFKYQDQIIELVTSQILTEFQGL